MPSTIRKSAALLGCVLERPLQAGTLGVIVLGFTLPHLLDLAILEAPVRVYVVDVASAALLAAAGWRLLRDRQQPPLWKHVGAILVVSAGLTWFGLHQGNPPADALGTLRRVGLYGTMTLVGTTAFLDAPLDWRTLRKWFLWGSALVVGVGVWRLTTGVGFREAYFSAAGVPSRYLSYLEALGALAAALLAFEAPSPASRRGHVARWGLFLILVSTMVASNYRGVWMALVVALVVREAARGGRRLHRLALGAGGLAVAGAVATALLTRLHPDSSPLARFSVANLRSGVGWRSASWSEAWNHFVAHPLTGEGFGYVHRFTFMGGPNLDTPIETIGPSIHNDLLWLMANGGLVLLVVVLSLHVRWVVRLVGTVAAGRNEADVGIPAALVGFLAGVWVIALLQPLLSHPSTAVALHALLGATWASARPFAPHAPSLPPPPRSS